MVIEVLKYSIPLRLYIAARALSLLLRILYLLVIYFVLYYFFSLFSQDTIENDNQVIVALSLTHIQTQYRILVICLHLKSSAEFSETRERQGRFIVKYADTESSKHDSVIVSIIHMMEILVLLLTMVT